MSLSDVTGEVPVKRMTVARGTLSPTTGATGQADMGAIETTTTLAIKAAHHTFPDVHAVQLTHVQVDLHERDDGIDVTVTVQAMSRVVLEAHALYGVSVALQTLRQQLRVAGILRDIQVVQNVE